MNHPLRSAAVLALATLLVAVPFASQAADPYEINVIVPSTGGAAFLGKEEMASLGVVEGVVNAAGGIKGRPIKFVYYDDQSSPQIALQLTTQVIAKNAPIILGSAVVSTCSAMVPAAKDGPVIYCFSPGIYPERGSYAFASSFAIRDFFAASARYFREKGWKRVALLASNDATGQDGENGINAAFAGPEGRGLEIVDRQHFNLTDISVSAQLAHVKNSGAQVLVAWVTGTAFGTVLHGASDTGLELPILASTSNLIYAQLDSYAQFMGNNLLFPGTPGVALDALPRGAMRNAVSAYLAAMKAAGVRPDQGHTLPWDPAMIVVDALRKLGTGATATQIRDYLMGLHDWTGINGTYDFRVFPQRGVGPGSIVMVRWDRSKGTWTSVSSLGGTPLK